RLVYGIRATPYEVMAGFTGRLADVMSVEEVLPGIAESTARGVGAVRTRVTAYLPGGGARTVFWPKTTAAGSFTRVIEVCHHGERVGEIAVEKAPGERLRPDE